jgi:prolyl oligopeptidase
MQTHPALRFLAPICLMAVVALAQGPVVPQPPATPKRPVTDEYGAIKVTDDNQWLENWDNPEVKQWSAAQNARTALFETSPIKLRRSGA